MTTNGLGLARRAAALKQAGLDRVNVSLDTVDAEHFARITRRDRLADVLAGLQAAAAAGLGPVKVNAVLDPQSGLDDVVPLLSFCLEHGYQLRIIEQMPLDAGHSWSRANTIEQETVLSTLRRHFDLQPDPRPRGSPPPSCGGSTAARPRGGHRLRCRIVLRGCDRPGSRPTADRSCLSHHRDDLRGLLRDGGRRRCSGGRLAVGVWAKPAGTVNDPSFIQPTGDERHRAD